MRKSILFIGSMLIFILGGCLHWSLEEDLAPQEKEFLSQVQYIITAQEKDNFLHLPPGKREAFIQSFWKKRDPDPETEVNEFKEQHLRRIDEANRLFTKNGKLEDRGMVHIMLGPPEAKEQYPDGEFPGDYPHEVWRYGFFRIFFYDLKWSGDYKLLPESARQLAAATRGPEEFAPGMRGRGPEEFSPGRKMPGPKLDQELDFRLELNEAEKKLIIRIPWSSLRFQAQGQSLSTTLDFLLEVKNPKGVLLRSEKKEYPLSFEEREFRSLKVPDYVIEWSLSLEKGNYNVAVTLENRPFRDKATRTLEVVW
jgi:GWxTD domain-containing protein